MHEIAETIDLKQEEIACTEFPPLNTNNRELNFFVSSQWQEKLQALHQFCEDSKTLGILVGGLGCGKTTLLNKFASEIECHFQTLVIQGSSEFNVDTLVKKLKESANNDKKKHFVCLIDDAHHLSGQALEAILQLAFHFFSTIQPRIILFGETYLKIRLQNSKEKLNSPLDIPVIELEPFNFNEAKSYIQLRLAEYGQETAALNERYFHKIFELSGGFAGRINRILHRMQNDHTKSSVKEKDHFSPSVVASRSIIAMTAIILLFFIFTAFFQYKERLSSLLPRLQQTKGGPMMLSQVMEPPAFAFIASIDQLPVEIISKKIAEKVVDIPKPIIGNDHITIGLKP